MEHIKFYRKIREAKKELNFILTISKKQVNQSLKMYVQTLYMYIDNVHIVSLVLYTPFKNNNIELESITDSSSKLGVYCYLLSPHYSSIMHQYKFPRHRFCLLVLTGGVHPMQI